MIKLVAVFRVQASLASAHSPGLDRRFVAQRPGCLVNAMNKLLCRLVA
jgi:hypothetical protein